MYEFIFAKNQTELDGAPTIFTFDAAELLRSYDWPTNPLNPRTEAAAAAELASKLSNQFGRRIAYRRQEPHSGAWTLTTAPATPSRRSATKSRIKRSPSDEVYELKLARENLCAFAQLPLIGTLDAGAYKRYGYTDGPDEGHTAKSCAITLLELFERSIAYRPAKSKDAWLVATDPDYFAPFDDETMRSLTLARNSSGLYRVYILRES